MKTRPSLFRRRSRNGCSWTIGLVFLLCIFTLHSANGQQSRYGLAQVKQYPSWVYEAESEYYIDGKLIRQTKTAYDRGKYRIINNNSPEVARSPSVVTYIFANTQPPILWIYDRRQRLASIDVNSTLYNFASLTKQIGATAMRQRYHVPERLLKKKLIDGLLYASFYGVDGLYVSMNPAADNSFARFYRKTGTEMVAGQKCTLYETRYDPRTKDAGKDRYWVEPRSHLSLKLERIIVSSNPRMAPTRILTVTKKIKFSRQLPPQLFQLPPGTTAYVPETMQDIALPPGVIRKPPLYREEAVFGFDLRTVFPSER